MPDVRERLTRTRIDLALREPFIATALLRLAFRPFPFGTGQTMATNGYDIFFLDSWVETLRDDELRGVLIHEIMHVVFGHVDRRADREPRLWNIACDYVINNLITSLGHVIPKGGLVNRHYDGLTAEQVYERLADNKRSDQILNNKDSATHSIVFDLVYPDIMSDSILATKTDGEQRHLLRVGLLRDFTSNVPGSIAGEFWEEIELAEGLAVPWHHVLNRWLSDRVKTDWRSIPFSKRHIWRGIYTPSVGVETPSELVFAVDTSGSMDDKTISRIEAEVISFRSQFGCRFHHLQFDAAIQSVESFDAGDSVIPGSNAKVFGRGGTSFIPVFEWIDREYLSPNAVVIIATDGYGTFPTKLPTQNVVWLVTRRGSSEGGFPFGMVVRMPV